MGKAFDMMMAGLDDAIAYVEGDTSRGRATTLDVRRVRKATHLTQNAFARKFCLPIGTLRDWEQGRRSPDSGSRTLLRMIEADPAAVERIAAKLG